LRDTVKDAFVELTNFRWVLSELDQDILFSPDALIAKSLELQLDPKKPDTVSRVFGRV
jgi:hypothetical protein